jgi:hypothetical protein
LPGSPSGGVRPLKDFGDWMSPMLVKELRMGLKSPFFVWGFLGVQLLLALLSLMFAGRGGEDLAIVFWWCLAGPVCLLLPLRLSGALREEMGGNTMDTLVLTRLSGWRIVIGKWVATAALQVLMALTVLPYLILRYFAGGIDVVQEIAWLGLFLLLGVTSSAVLLGLSFLKYFLLRAAVLLAVLLHTFGFCAVSVFEIARQQYGIESLHDEIGTAGIWYCVVLLLWAIFFFLDLGASQLAPESENRATPRRLAAMVMVPVATVLSLHSRENDFREAGGFVALGAAMLTVVQAMSEQPGHLRPLVLPFARRGFFGRLAGRVLLPGWHTGLIYATLWVFAAAWVASVYVASNYRGSPVTLRVEALMIATVCCGALGFFVFPIGLAGIFRKLAAWNFWWWLAGTAIGAVVSGIVLALWVPFKSTGLMLLSMVWPGATIVAPAMAVEIAEEQVETDYFTSGWYEGRQERVLQLMPAVVSAALISAAIWWLVALWFGRREFVRLRAAEREIGGGSL